MTSHQQVATLIDGKVEKGSHLATWDVANFASGIYFYSVEFNASRQMGRMLLVR